MGIDLLDRCAEIRDTCDRLLDFDIGTACAGAAGYLDRTDRLQPTLYTVNHLMFLARREQAALPAFFAGHSLGEINALVAAGFMTFEEGLQLVIVRGRLMHAASGGGMAAAVRIEATVLDELLATSGVTTVDIANRNSPTETVLSGPVEDLSRLTSAVRGAGGVLIPLKVSASFHSRYMRAASAQLAPVLRRIAFRQGAVAVLSNVTASEYGPDRAAELLTRQVCEPVRWSDCMQALRRRGVTEIVEVGPGGVLTKLWAANPLILASQTHAPVRARANGHAPRLPAEVVGSPVFCAEYGVKHAYVAGSMYRGIASVDLVHRMAAAGFLAFFGSGGLLPDAIDEAMSRLSHLCAGATFGCNLLHQPDKIGLEQHVVDAALRHRVRVLEASAFTSLSAPLVQYRYAGSRLVDGHPVLPNRLLAKVSRLEVARKFLAPPPADLIDVLVAAGRLTDEEASVARLAPVASDICVESDSGGHTDRGSALTLVPAMLGLRDATASGFPRSGLVRVGGGGGIGTPAAIKAMLALGAEFVLTGSINQCTPQAATSEAVKDLLVTLGVHDTTMAPAADMFEVDGRVQVVRKGTLFAARANRLQRVYREHRSWRDVDAATRASIERQILKGSYDDVLANAKRRYARDASERLRLIEQDPRAEMAAVFKTYLVRTTVAAAEGRLDEAPDFQIHCGPALGAFNQWACGTELADWRHRHVDVVADSLLTSVQSGRRPQPSTAPSELTG